MSFTVPPAMGEPASNPLVIADQRFVPALIDGLSVVLPCPMWCRVDHIAANPRYIEDVSHSSDPVRLDLATAAGAVSLVEARIVSDPASDRPASVYVEEHSTGQGWYVGADELEQAAVAAESFAGQLRAMAAQLRGDV